MFTVFIFYQNIMPWFVVNFFQQQHRVIFGWQAFDAKIDKNNTTCNFLTVKLVIIISSFLQVFHFNFIKKI